jgi:hypothetical protein
MSTHIVDHYLYTHPIRKRTLNAPETPPSKRHQRDDRKFVIWSHPRETVVETDAMTSDLRMDAAVETARKIDKGYKLDAGKTVVSVVHERSEFQADVYLHRNSDAWTFSILLNQATKPLIATAQRCLYDSLFNLCGYLPIWHPSIKAGAPPKWTNKRFRSRTECIKMNKRTLEENGITGPMLEYICGKKSKYDQSQKKIHKLDIETVAAALQRSVTTMSTKRAKVQLAIWRYVTGHNDYYEGVGDLRVIGTNGISQPDEPSDGDTADFDNTDESRWWELSDNEDPVEDMQSQI